MKATPFVAAALMAAGSHAFAQEVAAPAGTRPPTAAMLRINFLMPAVPPLAQAQEDQAQAAPPADRRDDIKTLEAVLTMAVKNGADKLALQMRASEPGSLFVIDTGRTRGFDLQGYGVFFDVDVPMMKQSVVWSTRLLTAQDTRAQLENYIATQPPGPAKELAIKELRRMQQLGQRQSSVAGPTPIASPGAVNAQTTDATADTVLASAAPRDPRDPNELYTEAVKSSLIDAMLKHSLGLKLGPDEWLTVAARDAQGPPTPGQPDDASTIVIRIKGSDLAAFHSNKLTREEVLKRVEVREF